MRIKFNKEETPQADSLIMPNGNGDLDSLVAFDNGDDPGAAKIRLWTSCLWSSMT